MSIRTVLRQLALCGLAAIACVACAKEKAKDSTATASIPLGEGFATPEAAVRALAALAGSGDVEKIDTVVGKGAVELLRSGDDVADRADALQFKALVERKLAFEDVSDDHKIALLGDDAWPFAIPLIREDGTWHFDVDAGREELLNRRVGGNELQTIETLHEIVDAQREYRAAGRDGNPPCYARKILSDDGTRNGLYWPVGPDEMQSPLGPAIAQAAAEGYRKSESGSTPFRGYYFGILLSQGKHAPGGAREYANENGLLTGGFAAVAWPARPGISGVKTFIVSQRGIVYEKDLGETTEAAASAMKVFDPDGTWNPVAE
jgi:hypothetical protein